MAIKLGGLADRLRASIEHAQDAQERAEAERKEAERRRAERREAAQAARAELMGELAVFGASLGGVKLTKQRNGGVKLGWKGHSVRFAPSGDDDIIAIELSNHGQLKHYITRDEALEWEVVLDEGEGIRRLPLEMGLEEVLSQGLEIPGLGVQAAPVPSVEPAGAAVAAPASVPQKRVNAEAPRASKASDATRLGPGSTLRELGNPWD